jgi:ATP-dependent Lon protease
VANNDLVAPLLDKVKASDIPPDLRELVELRLTQLSQLEQSPTFLPEVDRINRYIDWITVLPWNKRTEDVLDLAKARQVMDKNHYGLQELKDRVLEYLAVMKLKGEEGDNVARAPILCFVGLVGTGKTTFSYSLAEALNRKIARIPFGGMGDPLDLRGQSRVHAEAEPGKIIKALRSVQSRNPVILLDEIDRVTDEGRASIMGVLVELLDPEQNQAFVDHYIDYPFNLSEAVFVATANNTTNIATAVMDRLEPITMPSYNDQEKVIIAKQYVLPKALREAGMPENTITFDDQVWAQLVRPLGYDAGIRTLSRTVYGVVRKIALMVVEGKGKTFHISPENVKQYLPQW